MELNAIIVDDESAAQEALAYMLKHQLNLKILGTASNLKQGWELVQKEKPNLIFLDVNFPGGNGFDLLNKISPSETAVIFVSAYEKYVIRALRASAIDFLTKPVDALELGAAIEKARNWLMEKNALEDFRQFAINKNTALKENLAAGKELKKLNLPTQNGFDLIELGQVMYLEADGNYTNFVLSNGKKSKTSTNLGEYEDMLSDNHFMRIHRSVLVNLDHLIGSEAKGNIHYAILKNGTRFEISRRRLSEFNSKTRWNSGFGG